MSTFSNNSNEPLLTPIDFFKNVNGQQALKYVNKTSLFMNKFFVFPQNTCVNSINQASSNRNKKKTIEHEFFISFLYLRFVKLQNHLFFCISGKIYDEL